MKFSGKKLLVLAGASVHCKVVEAAKKMGVYTIVTDYLADSPAKKIADEAWMLNITDVDEIVKKCREEHVDGVLAVCIDPAQRPYQQICEKLNLPCFGNREQFHILTDKKAFKQCCIENNVDVIPEYSENNLDAVEFPVLVKPVDSRGSRGQTVCYNQDELRKGIEIAKNESSNDQLIIEKYMAGKQDFSMSYIVIDGEPYLVRTGDRYLGYAEDGLNKQCVFSVSPSGFSEKYIEKVHPRVVNFIKKIGIINGPLFMQGFIDGDTVRFYDPGLRLPGTNYENIYAAANGLNLMDLLVEYALTGSISINSELINNSYLLNGKISLQILSPAREGIICTYDGVDEIKAHPDIIMVDPRYKVGERVPCSGDVKQRVIEIDALSPEKSAVGTLIDWIYSKLKVLDQNGEDMLVSKVREEWYQ